MTDAVEHPSHYTAHPSGVECIEVTEHMGFNLGNAMKYLWRADEKGNALEDLRKAEWYVRREIKLRERTQQPPAVDESRPIAVGNTVIVSDDCRWKKPRGCVGTVVGLGRGYATVRLEEEVPTTPWALPLEDLRVVL